MIKSVTALGIIIFLFFGYAFAKNPAVSDQVPELNHVFLIMMENHSYSQIIGNDRAPFLNQYAKTANLATNFYAVGHPSLTNYLEVVGGSNFAIVNDNYPNWHNASHDLALNKPISGTGMDVATPAATAPMQTEIPAAPFIGKTIADQLVAVGKSWKSYQENLPASGADNVNYSDGDFSNLSHVTQRNVQKLYAVKHNPFAYFANIQANTNSNNGLNNIVGFDGLNGLYADLRSGNVPNFSFIAPNQCHDMHGAKGGSAFCTDKETLVQMGDASVKNLVATIRNSTVWKDGNNAIVILWDENDFSAKPNQVVAIVDTSYGVHGVASNTAYSHFSLLKTLEAGFNLQCLNHACDTNVAMMVDMFR